MNPCTSDQGGTEDYSGSEALDPALADRFALVVNAADWGDLTAEQQAAIVAPSGEGQVTPRNEALCSAIGGWRERFLEQANACPAEVTTYVTTVVSALNGAGVRISPRRARLLARSLVAATIVADRATSTTFQQRARVQPAAPDLGAGRSSPPWWPLRTVRDGTRRVRPDGAWIHAFLAEQSLPRKLELLLERCTDPDQGSQAVAQLIANEKPDRAAAFAFAVYPAALAGKLPIGAEGVNDLAKIAVPLIDAEGEIAWQERFSEKGTSHPSISEIGKVLAPLRTGGSRGRGSSSLRAWCGGSHSRPRQRWSSNSTVA